MSTISRILVPIDFLPHSTAAVRRAIELAAQYAAEVVLLHVHQLAEYPVSPGDVSPHRKWFDRLSASVLARLEAVRREVDPTWRLRIGLRVVTGTPARAILDASSAEFFDLIVMGTHGRTGADRLLAGSVAEDVMRCAPCAVLTVKSPRVPLSRRSSSERIAASERIASERRLRAPPPALVAPTPRLARASIKSSR